MELALKNKHPSLYENLFFFEIKKGWYKIIEELTEKLKQYESVKIVTIKEKFGRLRIYCESTNDEAEHLIDETITKASFTCEICGSENDVYHVNYGPRCKECRVDISSDNIYVWYENEKTYVMVKEYGYAKLDYKAEKEHIRIMVDNNVFIIIILPNNEKPYHVCIEYKKLKIFTNIFFEQMETIKETKADLELANSKLEHVNGFFKLYE